MQNRKLEPGILTALIWTLVLQLLMLVNTQVAPSFAHPSPTPNPYQYLPTAVIAALLMALLFPAVRRRVTPTSLLIILFGATAAMLVSRYTGIPLNDSQGFFLARSFFMWDQVIFLVIPLAIIAWQFSMKEVIIFCTFTAVFDILVEYILFSGNGIFPSPAGSIQGLRNNLLLRIGGADYQLAVPFFTFTFVSAFIRSIILGILGALEYRIISLQRDQKRELITANEKLAHYALTIEQLTVSRERNRMARELHDTLAHTLSSVAVELEAIKALVKPKPAEAVKVVDQTLKITRDGLNETRKALQDLRALPIEDLGLTLALKTQVQSIADRGGLKMKTRIDKSVDKLAPDMAYCIYRIAQEALENAVRHANASQVALTLTRSAGSVTLTIKDNGKGFDPRESPDPNKFGLRGMRERVEMLGGKLTIDSAPGRGTSLNLTLEETA